MKNNFERKKNILNEGKIFASVCFYVLHLLQGCGGGVAEVHGLVDDELVLLAVRSRDVVIRSRGQARLQHRLRARLDKDEKDVKKLVVKIK